MSIRKERYWLRNSELVHGAKMYVMPQLGVRISLRERCKPGPGTFCFSFAFTGAHVLAEPLVQIRPPQPKCLLFQSPPKPYNRPNL